MVRSRRRLRATPRFSCPLILVLLLSPLQFVFRDGEHLPKAALELPVFLRWRRVGVEFRLHRNYHTIAVTRYYFICTVKFRCHSCGTENVEDIGSDSTDSDPNKVAAIVMRQKLHCKTCRKPPMDGTQVDLHVEPVSLQLFRDAGFSPRLDS